MSICIPTEAVPCNFTCCSRGAFTSANNKPNGHFAVVPVQGDALTVEIYVPDAAPEPSVVIASVAHHYRETFFVPKKGDRRRLQDTRCQTSPPFTGYMCSLAW